MFASTPEPPYYVVTFTSQRRKGDYGYRSMSAKMFKLALAQSGCLGVESVRDENGFGITCAYFTDETAIVAWKQHAKHLDAQHLGIMRWYEQYAVRVAHVERAYDWP